MEGQGERNKRDSWRDEGDKAATGQTERRRAGTPRSTGTRDKTEDENGSAARWRNKGMQKMTKRAVKQANGQRDGQPCTHVGSESKSETPRIRCYGSSPQVERNFPHSSFILINVRPARIRSA